MSVEREEAVNSVVSERTKVLLSMGAVIGLAAASFVGGAAWNKLDNHVSDKSSGIHESRKQKDEWFDRRLSPIQEDIRDIKSEQRRQGNKLDKLNETLLRRD